MKGKTKKLFEEWFDKQSYDLYLHLGECNGGQVDASCFYDDVGEPLIPLSFQWGILQDFYDSQLLHIIVGNQCHPPAIYEFHISNIWWPHVQEYEGEEYKTRNEAREAALEKAEEILNERKPWKHIPYPTD